ncbi:MAG: DUF2079 domain-containing protein [Patescibacteria group bacterium]|nr:DUF2079 domain-containing protein [Patescibacteria group bacterium]
MVNYFKTLNWQKLAKITWILVFIYFIFTFSACLFKYFTYQYNALDLAIFNQVFYNTSIGKLFQFTIHPTLYLGDHFEIMILFLAPLYSLYKSPISLLLMQSLFLALSAIPLYLICKKHLRPQTALLAIILYLFNPVTLNINFFEFHMLALAMFFLFWVFYFYDENKFWPFIILSILTLMIREDLAFVIFMFGIVAIIDKKKPKWILTATIGSALYFLGALKMVSFFSASSQYKFLIYYKWLGTSLPEIAKNFFLQFPLVLQHVVNLANVELVLGFLLVFIFLPIYRPKYLLLCLGQFMEIVLGFASGESILRTHYATPFIFALSIATIFSLESLSKNQKALIFYNKFKDLILIALAITLIYNFLILGPLIPLVTDIATINYKDVAQKNYFVRQIPAGASLITDYDFISNLSSREKLYSLNYVFLGKQQYNAGDYIVPNETEYLLLNFNDFVGFHLQYETAAKEYYYQGAANMRKLLLDKNYHLKMVSGNLALWQRNYQGAEPTLYTIFQKMPEIKNSQNIKLADQIEFLGSNQTGNIISLYFRPLKQISENYLIKLDGQIYALGYGFYPTSSWQTGQIVQINFYDLPKVNNVEILSMSGGYELNGIGSISSVIDSEKSLGKFNLQ